MDPRSPGRHGTTRLASALLVGLVAALIAWSPVLATVSWSAPTQASSLDSRSRAMSLARTTTSTSSYLHTVFTRFTIGGVTVKDTGPYQGVYYRRGNSSGTSWGSSVRLNPSNVHADFGVVASSGKYVYTAWRTQTHIGSAFVDNDPRGIWFRRNTNHGSSTAWSAPVELSFGGSINDRPSIAASGSNVYVVWTDSSKNVKFVRSADYGATWSFPRDIAAALDLDARPRVAAAGSTVGLVWQYGSGSGVFASWSTDYGDNFAYGNSAVDASSTRELSATAKGNRIAFTWITDSAGKLLVVKDNSPQPVRTFATFSDTGTYKVGQAPAVALAGTSTVGVAWAACLKLDCSASSSYGINIRWRESSNDGAGWASTKTVASYATSSTRRKNTTPSALFAGTSRRFVLWNASGAGEFRTLIRYGSGTP